MQSFSRFLVSLGVFLCLVAIVMPAAIVRETAVLRVTSDELRRLTPLAREELHDRQELMRSARRVAPWAAIPLLLLGVGLAFYGLPRLKQQESVEDELRLQELANLMAAMSTQSQAEQEKDVSTEMLEELAPAPVRGRPSQATPAGQFDDRTLREVVWDAIDVESALLARISTLAQGTHVFRPRPKLRSIAADLRLDGVFLAFDGGHDDVVVEIKHFRTGYSEPSRRVQEAISLLQRYREATGRPAKLWLLLALSHEADSPGFRERLEKVSSLVGGDGSVAIVSAGDWNSLQAPDRLFAAREDRPAL